MKELERIWSYILHCIESPRAPLLWGVILTLFTCTFIAEIIGASYVYTNVHTGMEGQKTQQEKKLDAEVSRIYSPEAHADVEKFITERKSTFEAELMKRQVVAKPLQETSPEAPELPPTKIEQKSKPQFQ